MGNPRPERPPAAAGLPPPGGLLRGQRDGRLARGRGSLGARLRADRKRLWPRRCSSSGTGFLPALLDPGHGRPPGAPPAPLRAAHDLRRRGQPHSGRWRCSPRISRFRPSSRSPPSDGCPRADREDAHPLRVRGDARARGGAAGGQRGPQRRLHRRRRGRARPWRVPWSPSSASSRPCCSTRSPST
jgi:hypothetical protein